MHSMSVLKITYIEFLTLHKGNVHTYNNLIVRCTFGGSKQAIYVRTLCTYMCIRMYVYIMYIICIT